MRRYWLSVRTALVTAESSASRYRWSVCRLQLDPSQFTGDCLVTMDLPRQPAGHIRNNRPSRCTI